MFHSKMAKSHQNIKRFKQKYIFDGKSISEWEHHIPAITFDKGMLCHSTKIELFYFDDNFCRKAQWVLAFSFRVVLPLQVANMSV